LGAVFSIFFDFVVFEDSEGFAGEVWAIDIGGIEDIAQFVTGESVKFGVFGIEFGAEDCSSVFVPDEGRNREWGVGSGEWGVGSREWGIGNRE